MSDYSLQSFHTSSFPQVLSLTFAWADKWSQQIVHYASWKIIQIALKRNFIQRISFKIAYTERFLEHKHKDPWVTIGNKNHYLSFKCFWLILLLLS